MLVYVFNPWAGPDKGISWMESESWSQSLIDLGSDWSSCQTETVLWSPIGGRLRVGVDLDDLDLGRRGLVRVEAESKV